MTNLELIRIDFYAGSFVYPSSFLRLSFSVGSTQDEAIPKDNWSIDF